jgi:DNA-3-methyladenine glycosylase I
MEPHRCRWASTPLGILYHDREWGVPLHDDRLLFEMLLLEGAQAGLAWQTILNKRENYRAAFDNWDARKIAAYGDDKVAELLANPGIVRNRLKVAAAISNAKAYLRMREEGLTLDQYLWGWVGGKPLVQQWEDGRRPAKTALSDSISKDLSKRGFKFVGSTIIYAYLQGVGVVNDHDPACFCFAKGA